MKRKTLWAFLLSIPVVLSPLLVTGQESNPDTYRQLKLFGDVFERVRGPVSTAIRLTIRREGRAPLEVSITRDVIHIQATRARTQSEVGYVRITQFNEQTNSGLEKSIKQIE